MEEPHLSKKALSLAYYSVLALAVGMFIFSSCLSFFLETLTMNG